MSAWQRCCFVVIVYIKSQKPISINPGITRRAESFFHHGASPVCRCELLITLLDYINFEAYAFFYSDGGREFFL